METQVSDEMVQEPAFRQMLTAGAFHGLRVVGVAAHGKIGWAVEGSIGLRRIVLRRQKANEARLWVSLDRLTNWLLALGVKTFEIDMRSL